LFALHPIHVESVAWVTERKDVLSTLFLMLTWWSYWFYLQRPGIGRYWLIVFCFILGLMAKPMLVTLPFALLLLDFWPLDRWGKISVRRLLGEKVTLVILAAVSSVLTLIGQQHVGGISSIGELSLGKRIGNALVSYVVYLRKMIWPTDLAVFYPYPRFLPGWKVAFAALVLLAISATVLSLGRRHRYLLVGWLWYLGTLVPVIGLVQVGDRAMADRFAYVPFIGIYIMVVWGVPAMFPAQVRLRVTFALIASSLCVIAARVQAGYWRDSITLFEHTLRVTKDNSLAHYNLGLALAERGRFAEAVPHYSQAIHIKPQYADAENNLGLAWAMQGKPDLALFHYRRALEIDPDHARAMNNLGAILAEEGKMGEAIALYRRALQSRPSFAAAHNNLGFALAAQGNFGEAVVHYAEALRIEPDDAECHNNLGVALAQQGRLAEAIAEFSEALRLKPDYPKAAQNLALAIAQQKRSSPPKIP
jgi:Flp pilus assembly protein TadD